MNTRAVKFSYDGENRRCLLPMASIISIDAMRAAAQRSFEPLLRASATASGDLNSLKFSYVDEEGDVVHISCNEELSTAIDIMQTILNKDVLKFDVIVQSPSSAGLPIGCSVESEQKRQVHLNIKCDECGISPIQGPRFKCSVRENFDICETCEALQPQHPYPMVKIYSPTQQPVAMVVAMSDSTISSDITPAIGTNTKVPPAQLSHPQVMHPSQHQHLHRQHYNRHRGSPPIPSTRLQASSNNSASSGTMKGQWHDVIKQWLPKNCRGNSERDSYNETSDEQRALAEAIRVSLEESSGTATVRGVPISLEHLESLPAVPVQVITASIQPQPKLAMRLVRDMTIPDDTKVQPGSVFNKTWRLRNDGERAWPSGSVLVDAGGTSMMVEDSRVSVPAADVGTEVDVSVQLKAPCVAGRHVSFFRLQSCEGNNFGQRLWAAVVVVTGTGDVEQGWHWLGGSSSASSSSTIENDGCAALLPLNASLRSIVGDSMEYSVSSGQSAMVRNLLQQSDNDCSVSTSSSSSGDISCALVIADDLWSKIWAAELSVLREMGFSDDTRTLVTVLQEIAKAPVVAANQKVPDAAVMERVVVHLLGRSVSQL